MPASICPICNFANVDSTEECINCGASFQGARVPARHLLPEKTRPGLVDTGSAGTTSLKGEIVNASPERHQAQSVGRTSLPAVRSEAPARSAQESEQQRGVVSYRKPVLAPERGNENPYEGSRDMQPYYPQPLPFQTRVLEERGLEEVENPEPWKTDRLPWYLPRRRPRLTGKIVSMRNEMEFPDYPNVLRALADLIAEFIWIAANQPSHKEGERIQVTILRVRTSDGRLQDARLMGYMRGADLTLGDQVSFWGWKRRGSLLVRTGYNHTSRATITTNMMSMFLPGLILLALACSLTLFAIYHSSFLLWVTSLKHLFLR